LTKALAHPDWVRRMNLFGATAGDPGRMVSLDADEMLAVARDVTGLDDLGGAEWPGYEETYRRLLDSIERESQLHVVGRVMTRGEVLRNLETWLRLEAEWKATSAILDERAQPRRALSDEPRWRRRARRASRR